MKDYWYDRVQVSIFLCTAKLRPAQLRRGAGHRRAEAADRAPSSTSMKPLVKDVFYRDPEQQAYDRFKQQFKDSPVAGRHQAGRPPESFRVQLSDPTKYAVVTSSFTARPASARSRTSSASSTRCSPG